VHGQGKKRVLLSGTPGFHPYKEGMRKRKTVRGDTVSADIAQINVKVLKKGSVSLDEVAPMKGKSKEKPAEVKAAVETKAEAKTEVKAEQKSEKKTETKAEAKSEAEAAGGG